MCSRKIGRFADKVAIVTGSSNGIGRATAELFVQEGAKVTITGRSEKSLQETRDLLFAAGATADTILEIQGDLTDEVIQKRIVDETIARFGKIDILVNNAGGVGPDNSAQAMGFDQPIEVYDYVMNLNTRTVLTLTKYAMPHLIASKGEVVMVSSIAGLNLANTNTPYYAMSKAALDQLTRALAAQYIKNDVRVNSVNPGMVSTAVLEKQGITPEMKEKLETNICGDRTLVPCGFCGSPRDIAESIAFLADRAVSRYLVGHVLVVDGGSSIVNPMFQADFMKYL